VNGNFQTLFAKLFEGGEAKLTFTESDDPLEAGLEIYAAARQRLQTSRCCPAASSAHRHGADFAVFLVNPAPVCVLDEVDARWTTPMSSASAICSTK